METPESVAYKKALTKYAAVGALAVLTWDIVDNIPGDYSAMFGKRNHRKKLSFAKCVYIASRFGAFAYQFIGIIFSTAPVEHCALLSNIAFGCCPLSIAGTGLLFFLRLRAIYNRNRLIVGVFFILWLALLASAINLPFGFKGAAIKGTPYCTYAYVSRVAFYSRIAPLVFDTLVFIAISWRLSRISALNETNHGVGKKTINTMVFGTNLPTFSRGLLTDGQMYYLFTIIFGVASAVMSFSPLVREPLADLLEDSYLVLVNIMACRVFRRTMSGAIRESEISTSVLNQPVQFRIRVGPDSSANVGKSQNTL
ncbi:hypothetical protein D9619_012931 [Psilocybe cf. subviscida]|uniref:Uncharacterized protein n=1 Tax=Psilocybe cf. subviscida TaxID=2480587 RepID=A0A8H5F4P5_9AGAR|nr:hypothetical protein D9619_012931 [Psilocybe cf. subviscida]